MYKKSRGGKKKSSQREAMKTVEFAELQLELFGEKAYLNLTGIGNSMRKSEMKRITSQKKLNNMETGDASDDNNSDSGFDKFVSYLSA